MWSIHPSQIEPIVRAFRPDPAEVEISAAVLAAAQAADWAPIRHDGKLYDRASYRYCWDVLQQANAGGAALPAAAQSFFAQPPSAAAHGA
jgi:citrate lyase subunit beta/citryl-CoA lyase